MKIWLALLLLAPFQEEDLCEKLRLYFSRASGERPARLGFPSGIPANKIRKRIWNAYREGSVAKALKPEYGKRAIRSGKYTMPFTLRKRGKRPEGGWPVLIAMHGGGNAPKKVNDSQWKIMQEYYRVSDCIYIAPRAPTDAWNGFYTGYVYPLIARLIRAVNLFEEVNPDRVYLIGYSHGGYGAFSIGPKMADRFAAIHSSAAAPTDGQSPPENLMNTPFSFRVGEHDTAYGRLKRCRAFDKAIGELRKENPGFYPVTFEFMAGKRHTDLADWARPVEMFKESRNARPKSIRWKLTDDIIREFSWLRVANPGKGMELSAKISGNRIDLTSKGVEAVEIRLDDRLIPDGKKIVVTVNGKRAWSGIPRRNLAVLCRTLEERGDPTCMYDREIRLELSKKK